MSSMMSDAPKVLIVDDDREIVDGARLRLGAAGFDTMVAHDGEEGLAAAIANRPDAIILDVRMPRMDGLTALRKLQEREDTKDVPVIVLSASVVDQKAALDAGARFFLTKPYEGSTLITAVEAAIAEAGRPAAV